MTHIAYRIADVDSLNIFYRAAGAAGAPNRQSQRREYWGQQFPDPGRAPLRDPQTPQK